MEPHSSWRTARRFCGKSGDFAASYKKFLRETGWGAVLQRLYKEKGILPWDPIVRMATPAEVEALLEADGFAGTSYHSTGDIPKDPVLASYEAPDFSDRPEFREQTERLKALKINPITGEGVDLLGR